MSRKALASNDEKKISKICKQIGLIQNPHNTTNKEITIEIQKEITNLNGQMIDSEEKSRNDSKINVYTEMLNGNKKYLDFFYIKMKQACYIDFDFVNKHVMYFLLTNIIIEGKNKNYFVIKMGYSSDVFERIKSIEYKFGISCYPLYIKEIRTQHDETVSHKYILDNYSLYSYIENKFPKKVNEKKTEEFYYGTKHIFELFVSYVENIICDNEYKMEIEKTKQKQIEKEIETKKMEKEIETKKMDKEMKQIEKEIQIKQIEKEIEIKKIEKEKFLEIYKLLVENNVPFDDIKKHVELLKYQ